MSKVDWSSPEVVAAIIAALLFSVTWFFSAVWQIVLRIEERREAEWSRLQELSQTLHNGNSSGHWAQVLAVRELATLRKRRRDVQWLATEANIHWSKAAADHPELLSELTILRDRKPSLDGWIRTSLTFAVGVLVGGMIVWALIH